MYALTQIRNASELARVATDTGSYFFAPDTLRFFHSRIHTAVTPLDGPNTVPGARFLFITSEQYAPAYAAPEPRRYTVRLATLTASNRTPGIKFDTVGDFQEHATAASARRALRDYAARVNG